MVNVTATCFDLYPGHQPELDGNGRCKIGDGSKFSFNFTGTALYVDGDPFDPKTTLSITVDGSSSDPKIISPQANELPIPITGLSLGSHTVEIVPRGGPFYLGNITWDDPSLKSGPTIWGTSNPSWNNSYLEAPNPPNGYNYTNNSSATIQFDFEGTEIYVWGLARPDPAKFQAIMDSQDPTINTAINWIQKRWAVLYQVNDLPNKQHNLTLVKMDENYLEIGVAYTYIRTELPGSGRNSQAAPTPTNTQTNMPLQNRHSLSQGGAAGVAISMLLCVGLALFGLWFWIRKRQKSPGHFDKNYVIYDRMCSKCRQDITGNYRLECVFSNCPAAVDLHPECRDWNTPEHHDHEVRRVKNE